MSLTNFLLKKLNYLFIILPIFIFSQNIIDWKIRDDLNNYDNIYFESSSNEIINYVNKKESDGLDIIINLPTGQNNFENFILIRQNSFSKKLSKKFPTISMYRGKSMDKNKIVYLNFIKKKIYITILEKDKKITINNSKNNNLFVLNKQENNNDNLNIKLDNDLIDNSTPNQKKKTSTQNLDPVGKTPKLFKYRIAIIPTAEWSNYYINTYQANDLHNSQKRAIVLSEISVALSALNSITERDLGITFELVDNNELLIEFDDTRDGLTNNDKFKMLGEGSNILNNFIGFNNFDIGHVFNFGGGGVAYLSALCSSSKGAAVSGGTNSTGF